MGNDSRDIPLTATKRKKHSILLSVSECHLPIKKIHITSPDCLTTDILNFRYPALSSSENVEVQDSNDPILSMDIAQINDRPRITNPVHSPSAETFISDTVPSETPIPFTLCAITSPSTLPITPTHTISASFGSNISEDDTHGLTEIINNSERKRNLQIERNTSSISLPASAT